MLSLLFRETCSQHLFDSHLLMEEVFLNSPPLALIQNFWLWQFLGRLHPLIVHFPIGLLIIALVLELFTLNKKYRELRPAINIVLIIGTLSSVLAVALGWF